jgi:accessory gene regulator B
MFKKLSIIIADGLIQEKKISREDKDIYVYGLEILLMNLFNLVTTTIIGTVLGQLPECLLFLILFIPLRSYAGGYHAKNPLWCHLLSSVVLILVLQLSQRAPAMAYTHLPLLLASSAVIVFLALVENLNKPIDSEEKRVYGKRARFILAIETVAGIACHYFSAPKWCWFITLTILVMSVTLILGKVQNLFYYWKWQRTTV